MLTIPCWQDPGSHYLVNLQYEFLIEKLVFSGHERKKHFKATEEMVAILAFIGFYIFGICIYEIFMGLYRPSIERIRKESKENNQIHFLTI